MTGVADKILEWVREIGVFGFFDILFMSLLIYIFLAWFKRTRAAFVLKGIFIITVVYLLARQFNLVMMVSVFEKFFAVFLIVIIVIFQEELKYFFEQVASWSFKREIFGVKNKFLANAGVEILSRTFTDFAREKIGALVVIQGKDVIVRHLEGGVDLDGELSMPLLKSIFDPHSLGHDGAVVIGRSRVLKFSCHLPLSKNFSQLQDHGTRHAAALGLAELTDALCLVVSEERGTISVARHGRIQELSDIQQLLPLIDHFYQEIKPASQTKFGHDLLRKNSREKIYALFLSMGLWFVLVYGSKLTYQNFIVPVTYAVLPSSWNVREIDPKEIEVVLKGTRADFYFIKKEGIKVFLNLKLMKDPQEISVYSHNFLLPKNIILDSFEPHEVKVLLDLTLPH